MNKQLELDTLCALQGARLLIDDETAWTIRCAARNSRGISTAPASPSAVCWCAIGALGAVTGTAPDHSAGVMDSAMKALENCLPKAWNTLPGYNDHWQTKHKAVLRLFDRAIERQAVRVGA